MYGPEKVRQGEPLMVECASSPSNPAASLSWRLEQDGTSTSLRGQQFQELQEDGSFVTRSLLTVDVAAGEGHFVVVECYAAHPLLGADQLAIVHVVEILSPPGVPQISGISSSVEFGSLQRLSCQVEAGNPPATIHWFRGDQMMESHYRYNPAR